MEAKTDVFLANGAIEVWLIYPKSQRSWNSRASGSAERVDRLSTLLLPEFGIELTDLLGCPSAGCFENRIFQLWQSFREEVIYSRNEDQLLRIRQRRNYSF